MRTAAIVLAGGRSTRMGTPKADLEWHGSTLLRRAVGIAQRAVAGPVVVVLAPGQLPAQPLPAGVESATDGRDARGPMVGIAAGLEHIGDRADVVYVMGVDAPLLHPAFIRRVLALLGPDHEVALPHAHGFAQPLAAAYRTSVAPILCALLAEDESPGSRALLARCRVKTLDERTLVTADDPDVDSLLNVNDRGEYDAARARPAPTITLQLDGGPARRARAATLVIAARVARLTVDDPINATIDGRPVSDPQEPLVTGDRVIIHRAFSNLT